MLRDAPALVLLSTVLLACGGKDDGPSDDTGDGGSGTTGDGAATDGGDSGAGSGDDGASTSGGGGTSGGASTSGDGSGTGDASTSGGDATSGDTSGATATTSSVDCLESVPEAHVGEEAQSVMETWGADCSDASDCEALLGTGAICETAAVIYELPGGYCTKQCALPDTMTTLVRDAPDCDPNGGVDCVGAMGIFERCLVPCTAHEQCERDGFYCTQLPAIAQPSDPTYCLMPECCLDGC